MRWGWGDCTEYPPQLHDRDRLRGRELRELSGYEEDRFGIGVNLTLLGYTGGLPIGSRFGKSVNRLAIGIESCLWIAFGPSQVVRGPKGIACEVTSASQLGAGKA